MAMPPRRNGWSELPVLQYRDRRYEDGSTPAQMAAAWDAFFRRFARERAGKGLLVENEAVERGEA